MSEKIMYLMGGSGTGKTTLAKKLSEFCPEKYHRVVETSTRPIRPDEVDGYDYKFVSDKEYDKMKHKFQQSVQHQFEPYRYGSTWEDLDDDKYNIVVVSIEGFLSGVMNCGGWYDEILVNIIDDTELDVHREGRDALAEERINKSVLRPFAEQSNWEYIECAEFCVPYFEILLSELKTFRDDETKLLEWFDKNIITKGFDK